ncbi:MAG: hypothetical protein ACRCZ0_11105 [Cetobacterium sp.]
MEKSQKNLLNNLKDIFSLINSWLNFAEAKNALILSFFFGILYTFNSEIKNYNIFLGCFLYLVLLLGISSSLISFYPNLTNSKLEEINKFFLLIADFKINNTRKKIVEPIKIFYSDIADKYFENEQIKYVEYLQDLIKDSIEDSSYISFSQLEKDYAKEIIINSKITVNKYKLFKASLKILMFFIILMFSINIFEILKKI